MKLKVAKIPKSGLTLEEEEPPQIMGEALDQVEYKEAIRVRISVNLVGRTLVVRGKLSTTVVLECNRCLKKYDYPVEVGDYCFATLVKCDETVDLTDSIREDIMLSLPMKRLCSSDCKGLCPICGQDRSVSACNCRKSEAPSPFSQLDGLKL